MNLNYKESFEKTKIAGSIAAGALDEVYKIIKQGITTEEIDRLCHDYMVNDQITVPAPLNYSPPGHTPYPKSICTSINNQICHGIPNERVLKKGDIVKIKVKFNHPSFTGLGRADPDNKPSFNRAKPVTFIRNLFVYYDDELVTRFRMSSGIADDPLFTFKLKADKEAPVKVVFVDNHGEKWETSKKIKFKG